MKIKMKKYKETKLAEIQKLQKVEWLGLQKNEFFKVKMNAILLN